MTRSISSVRAHMPERATCSDNKLGVESSKGNVYCRECDDFVYDNALEEIRTQQGMHTGQKYGRHI
jgi:hypothetical protein